MSLCNFYTKEQEQENRNKKSQKKKETEINLWKSLENKHKLSVFTWDYYVSSMWFRSAYTQILIMHSKNVGENKNNERILHHRTEKLF